MKAWKSELFKTWLTEKIGTKYPIIQGAMLWLANAELAAAVCNAGGLGTITSSSFTPEELRAEIRKMKALTDRPFAINISLLPGRREVPNEKYISVAAEEQVKIIETAGSNPTPYIGLLKASQAWLMHKAARVRDLKTAERLGYDAVTIVGFEAGGHPGMEDVASLVLVPKAVDSVKIPVIAAGGFVDGRGLVAALALGAQGVQMGTRFMLSRESPLHPRMKAFLLQKAENETRLLLRSLKDPVRVVRTEYAQKVADMEAGGSSLEELYPLITSRRSKAAYQSGDYNDSLLICGEAVGLIREAPGAGEIIEKTMREAEEVVKRLAGGGR